MPIQPPTHLAADIARQRQSLQSAQIDALDAKAATLLGFVGVILALLIARDDLHFWPLVGAAAFLGLSIVFVGYVLWPRSFKINPNLKSVMHWTRRGTPDPNLMVAASIDRAIGYNRRGISHKTRGLQLACLSVGVALTLLTIGVFLGSEDARSKATPHEYRHWESR